MEQAMKKVVFAIVLIAIGAPARAEVITYSCVEPDQTENKEYATAGAYGHPMVFRIDTRTHAVQQKSLGKSTQGIAEIDASKIAVTITNGLRPWSITIDRSTGASLDSDEDIGQCRLVK
jgi:hypothetical protein